VSFKTTDVLEGVRARLEARTARVDRRQTSDQRLRWCASALWPVDAQSGRVNDDEQLPLLAKALTAKITTTDVAAYAAYAASRGTSPAPQRRAGHIPATFEAQSCRPRAARVAPTALH
jgi:hypothetical protein